MNARLFPSFLIVAGFLGAGYFLVEFDWIEALVAYLVMCIGIAELGETVRHEDEMERFER